MTAVKDGVKFHGLTPQLVLGIMIVRDVFKSHGYELVITSLTEGEHQPGSLHYIGMAFDARKWDIPVERRAQLLRECNEALGHEWDCLESRNNFHFEWDPKGDNR